MSVRHRAVSEALEVRRLLAVTTGTVTGLVFADPDQTGVAAGAEPVAGRVVYVDVTGAGVRQPADPWASTDAAGRYAIAGVPAGTYPVRQAGGASGQTVPAVFNPMVTVTAGGTATRDFGARPDVFFGAERLPGAGAVADAVAEPDGKIVTVGSGGSVRRFFLDGRPDLLFGPDGTGVVTVADGTVDLVAVVAQPDGVIDVLGNRAADGTGYAAQVSPDGRAVVGEQVLTGTTFNHPGQAVAVGGMSLINGEEMILGVAHDATPGPASNASGGEPVVVFRNPVTRATSGPGYGLLATGTAAAGDQYRTVDLTSNTGAPTVLTYRTTAAGEATAFAVQYPINRVAQAVPLLDAQLFQGAVLATPLPSGEFEVYGYSPTTSGASSGRDLVIVRLSYSGRGNPNVGGGTGVVRYPLNDPEGTADSLTDLLRLPTGEVFLTGTNSPTINGVTRPLTAFAYRFTADGTLAYPGDLAAQRRTLTLPDTPAGPAVFLAPSGLPTGDRADHADQIGPAVAVAFGGSVTGLFGSALDAAAERVSTSSTQFISRGSTDPVPLSVVLTDATRSAVDRRATGDLVVITPKDAILTPVYRGVTGKADHDVTLQYDLPAPAGGWTSDDNGTYSVDSPGSAYTPSVTLATFTVSLPYPPTAKLDVAPTVTERYATSTYFGVTYQGSSRTIDWDSIGTDDVTVTAPDGHPLAVTEAQVANTKDDTLTAYYTVAAPAGGFSSDDNGAYTVAVVAGRVADAGGTTNAQAGPIGSFVVDVLGPDRAPPAATLQAPTPVFTAGAATLSVTVSYADQTAVAAASVDPGDLVVTSPAGVRLAAAGPVAGASADGPALTVTYTFAAPSPGGFNLDDDGAYTVALADGAVADTVGHLSAAAVLGSAYVALRPLTVTADRVPAVTAAGTATVAVRVSIAGSIARHATYLGLPVNALEAIDPAGRRLVVSHEQGGLGADYAFAATYLLTPVGPDGLNASMAGLTPAANGRYTIRLESSLADSAGMAVRVADLGTLLVAVPADAPTTPGTGPTTVAVAAGVAAARRGVLVPISATVTAADGAVPTGSVTFFTDAGPIGTAPLDPAGHAALATADLPAGADAITAVYGGDATHATALSSATASVVVTGPAETDPELVPTLTAVVLPTVPAVAGAAGRFAAVVHVYDPEDPVVRGVATLNLYASADSVLDGTDALLATVRRRVAGLQNHLTVSARRLPATLADGTYHLLVQVVDPLGFARSAASGQTFAVAAARPVPTATLVRTPPSAAGGAVAVRVGNAGNVPPAGPVTVAVYRSASGVAPADGTPPADAVAVATVTRRLSIKPGRSATVTVPVRRLAPAGPAHWVVVVTMPGGPPAVAVDPTAVTLA